MINVSFEISEYKVEVEYIAIQCLLKVAALITREIIPEGVVRFFPIVDCRFRLSVIYFVIQAMKI